MEKLTLIFGRSNKAVGLLIRFFDICPYGHVAIVNGDIVYEAVGTRYKGRLGRRKGVIKTHIDDFKKRYNGTRQRFVYLPPHVSIESVNAECERLVALKTDYDFMATIGSLWLIQLFRIKLGHRHDLNCSELVGHVTGLFTHGVVTVASCYNISRPMSEY
jgi:hypothetical protein